MANVNRLERLVKLLAEEGVELVLAGGYAALTHGSSLTTQDVDVAFRMTRENLERLEKALSGLNPVHRMTPQKMPLDFSKQGYHGWKNIYLRTEWGQLDCLGEVKGIGNFDDALSLSEELEFEDGTCIRILTLDALIKAKEAMGRPRDIHAAHELKAIRDLRRKGSANP